MFSSKIVIIFVKYPKEGFVKTRLAKDIGSKNAVLLYRLFVETVLKRTKDKCFKRLIFYTPNGKEKEFKSWLGNREKFYPQKGRSLGQKLSNAFKFAFQNGAKRVIIIGTDSPSINKNTIRKAFKVLDNKQCVIGPALDGGYYLIGLSFLWYRKVYNTSLTTENRRKLSPKAIFLIEGIFKGIKWGTKKVFRQTISKLRQLKINYSFLDKNFDVDTYQDLLLLKGTLQKKQGMDLSGLGPIIKILRGI